MVCILLLRKQPQVVKQKSSTLIGIQLFCIGLFGLQSMDIHSVWEMSLCVLVAKDWF